MKNILIVLTLLLTSCSPNMQRGGVESAFPNCEIMPLPSQNDEYIVRKPDGSVYLVFTGNPFSTKPTSVSLAFPANK